MTHSKRSLTHYLRVIAGAYRADASTDAELLARYVDGADEEAFATLAVRYGPMVWRICIRILGNAEDAEDALQVAFLALARKARKMRIKSVGAWMHEVSRQAALDARARAKSQQNLHRKVQTLSRPEVDNVTERDDVYGVLHEEVAGLPERLRVPLVLHYFEGRTQVEIAQMLKVSDRCVRSRLARGKSVLLSQFAKRGLTVTTMALGTLLAEAASHASLPSGLLTKTVQAAVACCQGKLTGRLVRRAEEVLKQIPTTPARCWHAGWAIVTTCACVVGVGGIVAWKIGYFGPNMHGPRVVAKLETPERLKNEKAEQRRFDLYGDPLPLGALARLGTVRFRHEDEVVGSLQFTSDGKAILTSGYTNPPRLWSVPDGREVRRFGDLPAKSVGAVVLSPNGKYLACRQISRFFAEGDANAGSLHIWKTATGKPVRAFRGDRRDHDALNCAFSPDGKKIVAQLHEQFGVWEVETGREVWALPVGRLRMVAFSPDGATVVSGSALTSDVSLRDAHTGRIIRKLGLGPVSTLLFSPDGAALLVHSASGNQQHLGLYDVKSGKVRCAFLIRHKKPLISPTFSPNGKVVVAYIPCECIQRWETATGKELSCWRGYQYQAPLAYSPDGRILAATSGPGAICFLDADSGQELNSPHAQTPKQRITSAVMLADDDTVASGGFDQTVRLWSSRAGRQRQVLTTTLNQMWGSHPVVSPDGKRLAAVFSPAEEGPDGIRVCDIRVWDATTGRAMHWLRSKGEILNLSFSSNGKWLSAFVRTLNSAGKLREVMQFWQVESGAKMEREFPGYSPWLFSPCGNVVITFEYWRTAIDDYGRFEEWIEVAFWEVATGKKIHRLQINDCRSGHSAISSDGRTLAISTREGITLYPLTWSSRSSEIWVGTPRNIGKGVENTVFTFSPDGKVLATGGGGTGCTRVVHLLEAASGKERSQFSGHLAAVRTLCFSADGRRLVTGSWDTTLLVWDVTGGFQDDSGRLRLLQHTGVELRRLWDQLRSKNAGCAGRAVWELSAAGNAAVAFLEKHLQPIKARISQRALERLILDLDAADFHVRRRARTELAKLGESSASAMQRAMMRNPSLEMRRSLQSLVSAHEQKEPSVGILRELRAIEVLEQIATPKASRMLKKLGEGDPDSHLTQAAEYSLNRIKQLYNRRKKPATIAREFEL